MRSENENKANEIKNAFNELLTEIGLFSPLVSLPFRNELPANCRDLYRKERWKPLC